MAPLLKVKVTLSPPHTVNSLLSAVLPLTTFDLCGEPETDDAELAGLRRRAAFRNTFEPDAGYLKACAYKKEAAALGSAIPWIEEYLQTL